MVGPRNRAAGAVAKLAIATMVAAFALFLVAAGSALAGVIPTDKGPVRGTSTAQVNEYLGIPYAAPPVGDLRWRAPRPAARWHGPLDATSFVPHCAQTKT